MTDSKLLERITVKEPKLWISRVVLYKSDIGWTHIRDIPFFRGVNIIRGIGTTAEEDTEKGHSVGKTTLLRLIRYALGEDNYSSEDDKDDIIHSFPRGHIGVTLHIGGETWSVIRDIGVNGQNKAAKSLTLETLTQTDAQTAPYDNYIKTLNTLFVDKWEFKRPPKSDRDYDWKHLLAWMIRDQNARYREFHIWSDRRSSGSSMPQFKFAKQDAMHFVRMILDATRKDEYDLEQKIGQIETKIEAEKEAAKEKTDSVKARKTVIEKLIRSCLPPAFVPQIEFRDLKDRGRQHLEDKYNLARDARAAAEESLTICRIKIKKIDEAVRSVQTAIAMDKSRRSLPKELVENDFCPILGCRLQTCDKFLARVNEINQEILALNAQGKLLTREEQHVKITERLELTQQLNDLRVDEATLGRNIPTLIETSDTAKSLLTNFDLYWEQWDTVATVSDTSSGITQVPADLIKAKSKLEASLLTVRLQISKTYDELSKLYDSLCESILGHSYGGEIESSPTNEDFDFRIISSGARRGKHGAAVSTLSSHIADITPLIWSAQGRGCHPGFLVHDSPREADMTDALYSMYLKGIKVLSDDLGGSTHAPFQYIISTTTEPPPELKDSVRLTLSSHPHNELLFKQPLGLGELDLQFRPNSKS